MPYVRKKLTYCKNTFLTKAEKYLKFNGIQHSKEFLGLSILIKGCCDKPTLIITAADYSCKTKTEAFEQILSRQRTVVTLYFIGHLYKIVYYSQLSDTQLL